MNQIIVPDPEHYLYIVSDSHLDHNTASYQEFIAMLSQLHRPQIVICLGDLFKVWLALPKFWAAMHQDVMQAFALLIAEQHVEVIFVAGNREVLLPRKWNAHWKAVYPFTYLIRDYCSLNWGDRKYGFTHGDIINWRDLKYLRWRKFARSYAFEWFFRAIPTSLARRMALRLEATLAETNQAYKIQLPEKEIEDFAKVVLQDLDHYFVGHFHQDKEYQFPNLSGKLRIVPDWLSKRAVLQIAPDGTINTLYFKHGSFQQSSHD
ncbi:MAG: metallophosphoesterase [SAR324 cluster bacterium]|nr:metallophosphoesterase [SAR324 cluster bacterium]